MLYSVQRTLTNYITAYYFIVWRMWLHLCLDGNEDNFTLRWKSALTSIPRVLPVSHIEDGNGLAKGRLD